MFYLSFAFIISFILSFHNSLRLIQQVQVHRVINVMNYSFVKADMIISSDTTKTIISKFSFYFLSLIFIFVEVKNYFKAISRERTVFGPLPPPAHSILYIYVMDPICNT